VLVTNISWKELAWTTRDFMLELDAYAVRCDYPSGALEGYLQSKLDNPRITCANHLAEMDGIEQK
jgi:hypothetical protein